jgi:hypothetical protein
MVGIPEPESLITFGFGVVTKESFTGVLIYKSFRAKVRTETAK